MNDPESKHVTFDKNSLRRFKRAYAKAVNESKDEFSFEGNQFVVGYAKYLIEYLETKLL